METISGKWMHKAVALAAAFLATASYAQEPVSGICDGNDAVAGTVNGMVEAGTRVFALTSASGNQPDGGGLYISCTGGDNWFKHPDILESGIAIAADPADANTIYASIGGGFVYVSRDAGETWVSSRPVEFGNINISALTALPGGQVFAGMGGGELLVSNDYGLSWQSLNTSLPFAIIHTILVDPVNANRILVAVGDNGVYQSLDGGQSFQKSTLNDLILQPEVWVLRDIVFAPSNSSQVYAAGLAGLWQSVDGGYSFSSIANTTEIVDMVFGQRDTETMFLVSKYSGVLRSADGGQSFTLLAPELPDSTNWFWRVLQLDSGRLLVGTVFEGLYMSDDDGATWQNAGTAPPPVVPPPPPPAPEGTANLVVSIENLNGPEAIEYGSNARFRIVVSNQGPDVSTDTFVQVGWTIPGINDTPSWAFNLSTNAGSCAVGPAVASGCAIGTLGVGGIVSIEFSGRTTTDYIGSHGILVTARNAEGAGVTVWDSVATKRSVLCVGDCDDGPTGGGGSAGILLLAILVLLVLARNRGRTAISQAVSRRIRIV